MSMRWRPSFQIGSVGDEKSTQSIGRGTMAAKTAGYLRMNQNTAWKSSLLISCSMYQAELFFYCLGYLGTFSCTWPCCIYCSMILGYGENSHQGQCSSLVMYTAWMYLPEGCWGAQGCVPYLAGFGLVCYIASMLHPCMHIHISTYAAQQGSYKA